jgi:hypothetical protein
VLFQSELAFEGVDDALDALADAAQVARPSWLVAPVRALEAAPRSVLCRSKAAPAKPLSPMTVVPASSQGGVSASSSAATSRSPSLGVARHQLTGMPSGAVSRYSLRPQYQRLWLRS